MRADLHVHSKYSQSPSQWFLRQTGCPESFTEPKQIYRIARLKGMSLITLTDHNRIDGALEIAHLPHTFVSQEITTFTLSGSKNAAARLTGVDPTRHTISCAGRP